MSKAIRKRKKKAQYSKPASAYQRGQGLFRKPTEIQYLVLLLPLAPARLPHSTVHTSATDTAVLFVIFFFPSENPYPEIVAEKWGERWL